MEDINEQIERIKMELSLFLEIAQKLNFPEEEIEKQINLYLDSINELKNKGA